MPSRYLDDETERCLKDVQNYIKDEMKIGEELNLNVVIRFLYHAWKDSLKGVSNDN